MIKTAKHQNNEGQALICGEDKHPQFEHDPKPNVRYWIAAVKGNDVHWDLSFDNEADQKAEWNRWCSYFGEEKV